MTHGVGPQRLVSVGSIVADLFMTAPYLPPRGGDVVASSARLAAGGGFNVLSAAARQGLPALFAGRHGTGPYGDCVRAALAHEGIGLLQAATPDADSGVCVVIVEPDGERTFITSPGVEAEPGPNGLAHVKLDGTDAVFCSGYDLSYPRLGPAIAGLLSSAPRGVLLIVDPGPLVREIPAALRRAVFLRAGVLTLNRREARLLTGSGETAEVARWLRADCESGALLILRDGAAGCEMTVLGGASGHGEVTFVPAPAVVAIDTTGAGDTHTGVLIAALAQGCDPLAAARRANAAAAISVTRRGPATAPRAAELHDALAGVTIA